MYLTKLHTIPYTFWMNVCLTRIACSLSFLFSLFPTLLQASLSDTQITTSIEKLGAPSYRDRESASLELWASGPRVEAALREAAISDDPEVRIRARELLDKIQVGLFPDTPPELATMIRSYLQGTVDEKLAAIQSLTKRGPEAYRTLLRLMRHGSTPTLRSRLMAQLSRDGEAEVKLIAKGPASTELEELLELKARIGNDRNILNFCAYASLNGTLDTTRSRFRTEFEHTPDRYNLNTILLYLHRTSGHLKETLALGADIDDTVYETLLYEAGDFAALAKGSHYVSGTGDTATIGFRAAFNKILGNNTAYTNAIAALVAQDTKDDDELWFVTEALLINEELDRALDLLSQSTRLDWALALLRNSERLSDIPAFMKHASENAEGPQVALNLEYAEFLAGHGRQKEVEALLLKLLAQREDYQAPTDYYLVLYGMVQNNMKEVAFKEVIREIDSLKTDTEKQKVLLTLFPVNATEARRWWQYFRNMDTDLTTGKLLSRIDNILTATEASKAIRGYLEGAEGYMATQTPNEQALWVSTLSSRWHALGDTSEARRLMGALFKRNPRPEFALYVASIFADEENWKQAGDWFKQAWTADPAHAAAAYGYGMSLTKMGKNDDGQKILTIAHWLPLADNRRRYQLSEMAAYFSNTEDAQNEWLFINTLNQFSSWYRQYASRNLEQQSVEKGDYHTALIHRQRGLLDQLPLTSGYVGISGYLLGTSSLHVYRAHTLLEKKKAAAALDEARKAFSITAADIDGLVTLFDKFEDLGHKKQANALFKMQYDHWKDALATYPDSPLLHNNLAWLCAISNRKLDEAMTLSKRSLDLSDGNQNYIDTLAEIYFRLGNRKKAVEIQKRCVATNPDVQLFQDRLKHFQESPLPKK